LGSKFQDADLIGSPIIIVFGKDVSDGYVEIHHRVMNQKERVLLKEIESHLIAS
jgi:prolyl-tRNA synthetase